MRVRWRFVLNTYQIAKISKIMKWVQKALGQELLDQKIDKIMFDCVLDWEGKLSVFAETKLVSTEWALAVVETLAQAQKLAPSWNIDGSITEDFNGNTGRCGCSVVGLQWASFQLNNSTAQVCEAS